MNEPTETAAFINCPYDANYLPLFRTIIYMCYKFNVTPRFASEDASSGNRMTNILKLIDSCGIGIHDISRTEISKKLPRFNMPFELGIDFLHKEKIHSQKKLLILDKKQYQYSKLISDLSCLDISAHNDNPQDLIEILRNFFISHFDLDNVDSSTQLLYEYNTIFLQWMNENVATHMFDSLDGVKAAEFKIKVKKFFTDFPEYKLCR